MAIRSTIAKNCLCDVNLCEFLISAFPFCCQIVVNEIFENNQFFAAIVLFVLGFAFLCVANTFQRCWTFLNSFHQFWPNFHNHLILPTHHDSFCHFRGSNFLWSVFGSFTWHCIQENICHCWWTWPDHKNSHLWEPNTCLGKEMPCLDFTSPSKQTQSQTPPKKLVPHPIPDSHSRSRSQTETFTHDRQTEVSVWIRLSTPVCHTTTTVRPDVWLGGLLVVALFDWLWIALPPLSLID